MLTEYLYKSNKPSDSKRAIVILPEIYGLKPFAKELADRCAAELGFTGYALDYFWALTHESNDFDYQAGMGRGIELMNQMTGELFMELLGKVIERIKLEQPELERLVVVGFCFGGRLAYLSGVHDTVTDIISFYGAGSTKPGFYHDDSAISATVQARQGMQDLRVLGLFGAEDDSIPEDDRKTIAEQLQGAGISVTLHEYVAGHAFFNADRTDRYVAEAASQAWHDVKTWLGTETR